MRRRSRQVSGAAVAVVLKARQNACHVLPEYEQAQDREGSFLRRRQGLTLLEKLLLRCEGKPIPPPAPARRGRGRPRKAVGGGAA